MNLLRRSFAMHLAGGAIRCEPWHAVVLVYGGFMELLLDLFLVIFHTNLELGIWNGLLPGLILLALFPRPINAGNLWL